MLYRAIQVICILLLAAVIYAVNTAVDGISTIVGDRFSPGFVVGVFFTIGVYLLIMWVDPSSRPRGSAGGKQRPNDRAY